VVVIEHNLDVIKTADWIVDLGPEGGEFGGTVVAEGTPEEVVQVAASYTGQYLRPVLRAAAAAAGGPAPDRAGASRSGARAGSDGRGRLIAGGATNGRAVPRGVVKAARSGERRRPKN
jgi:excinuclease ABC subunit A